MPDMPSVGYACENPPCEGMALPDSNGKPWYPGGALDGSEGKLPNCRARSNGRPDPSSGGDGEIPEETSMLFVDDWDRF